MFKTVSRREERKEAARRRWPLLSQMMAGYFHEDFILLHGSADGALAQAVTDATIAMRQTLLAELEDWIEAEGSADDIRRALNDGLSVKIGFRKPRDARDFVGKVRRTIAAAAGQAPGRFPGGETSR